MSKMLESTEFDFIPDLPPGPLDKYRKDASFDWKRLKVMMELNVDNLKLKYEVWNTLESDPIFAPCMKDLTGDEQKRRSAMQLEKFATYKFFTDYNLSIDFKKKVRYLTTVNESIKSFLPDMAVKIGIGTNVSCNFIYFLGTERHKPIFNALWNREILMAIGLTEVAHGSNTKALKTTAKYDPSTREFVINTPDFEAAKCFVGNLGKTCTHCIVFAQLYTADDTCYGVHPFIVPIRDPRTLIPYPGLIVGDVGDKIGLNGIDNGFAMFQNYRIKREYLLNRLSDVTPDGEYESSLDEPAKNLSAILETLIISRIGILQESVVVISSAIVIAIRYAAVRKQFSYDGSEENSIIEYQLHQWRLFPYLASAVLFKLFIGEFSDIYFQITDDIQNGKYSNDLGDIMSETHAVVSATKPLITWNTLHAIRECREACGGHGFLKMAGFGELQGCQDAAVTYEGDNNVLGQQTSNWLVQQWESIANEKSHVSSPLKILSFFNDGSNILKRTVNIQNIADIQSEKFILSSYQWLICWLAKLTHKNIADDLAKGKSKFEARCNNTVFKGNILSKVYAEYIVLYYCSRVISNADDTFKPVLYKLYYLYGLSSLDKHLKYFYQGRYTSSPKLSELINESILKLLLEIKPEAVAVADSLAPTDFILNSVIGKSDGMIYKNLHTALVYNSGSIGRPSWWHEIVKSKI